MPYKKNRTIIQGTALHKDMLNIAREGYSGNNMPDGRHASAAFQLKGDLNKDNELSGYEANRQAAIDKAMAERDNALPMTEDVAMKMKSAYKKEEDVTEEYKTKGNKNTRQHIADGGTVIRLANGSIVLRKDA
tara:strand:+ start:74 stop:472 length:399 start_codon:yes stop_codon:yes gene_type:complete